MAERTSPSEWLLRWFRSRGELPSGDAETLKKTNYFEAGLVDSLGVVELITAIEEEYGIRFEQHHFQDRRFSTIGGLSDIVTELVSGST